MTSPTEIDRAALDRYVAKLRDMDEASLSREVLRMTTICLTESDEYDVKKIHWYACYEAARAFPGLFEKSLPFGMGSLA